VLLGTAAVGLARLVHLQFGGTAVATSSDLGTVVLPAIRGSIFDSHGYLLAVETQVYDLGATPAHVRQPRDLAARLAPLLHRPSEELAALLTSTVPYVQVQRDVPLEIWSEISSWDEGGIQADSRVTRSYPQGSLAAHVLGFLTVDGEAAYGVECFDDSLLAGKPGSRSAVRDVLGSRSYRCMLPADGSDLHLTLDRNAQQIVEEELSQAVVANQALKGVAIVMDPSTGAILALAVAPAFDPNTRLVEDANIFTNAAVSEPYEPGSVFKILTVAAALDAGVITPDSTYYDGGSIVVGGERIENSDHLAYGETSIAGLLANSLNVGAAYLSTHLGAFEFYDYVRRFGFAEMTGIDLAYEVPGWVRLPGDREWHESDLGTNSFGQGLAVTPLQMLSAVSAIANGGVLMRPYVVDRIVSSDVATQTLPHSVRRVVSKEVASAVTEMLIYAVDTTLSAAAVPGFDVAGKSGTSQVPAPGGYDPIQTIASFTGYVPARAPRLAILVTLHQPQREHWGTRVAAPVFREIAWRLLQLYTVPSKSASVG